MRTWQLFSVLAGLLMWEIAGSQLVQHGSLADRFITGLLEQHAGIETCRDEFDARFLLKFDYADGSSRKWEEPDAREPGVTNHMMEWKFPGYRLIAFTFFSFYGPSTWVHQLELSAPTELPHGLQFGDSADRFHDVLRLAEHSPPAGRVITDHADVELIVDDEGSVRSIIVECVAD